MSAPRIDTLRNQLDNAAALLKQARDELEDLHDLAYSRSSAKSAHDGRPQQRHGGVDYALDNHGDPKARSAYRALAEATLDICSKIESAVHGAASPLRAGQEPTRPTDESANATRHEVAEALVAQERRRSRGEYVPVARERQKLPRLVDQAQELTALTGAVRKVATRHRPDRSLLTPLEYAAWKRAARPSQLGWTGEPARRGQA